MRKITSSFAILFLLITLFCSSCKKEQTLKETDNSINPVEKLLTDSCTIDSSSIIGRTVNSSIAIRFKSTQNGKITHIGLRSNAGKFKIGLYDMPVDDNRLLMLDSVIVSGMSSFVYADITDVTIVANKTYWIVYSNIDLISGHAVTPLNFNFNRDGAELPISISNFVFSAMQSVKTTDINDFAGGESTTRIFGVPAFKFIAD